MAALLGAASCGTRPGRVALPEALPADTGRGPLRPLGVLWIDTAALGADGLSGLHVGPDLTLTAVADRGGWTQARLILAPDGRPLDVQPLRHGRMRDGLGRPLAPDLLADAESLAALPGGGWAVGFERDHRIWRYPALDAPPEPVEAPPGLTRAPFNASLESLGILPDGRWLAIAEGLRPPDDPLARQAWIGGPGRWAAFSYRPEPQHDPSDLCPLPDGGALVLERRFGLPEGFSARIARLPPLPANPALMEAPTVARLEPPLPSDNWEGISAFRHRGRDLVAVISDDNQFFLQKTLLMILGWDGGRGV